MPRSVAAVEAEVARLRGLDPASLRARYRAVTGRPAPRALSTPLLVRVLCFRVQADAFGDLSREAARLLDRIGQGGEVSAPSRAVRPGTVLVREWNGSRHHVMVDGEGCSWEGRRFGSLSEVARAITGTNWSGPRFFGLKPGPGTGSQEGGRAR